MAESWERQPEEHAAAYDTFVVYRNLGPSKRSISKTAKMTQLSADIVRALSDKHAWPFRVDLFDVWVQKQRDEKAKATLERDLIRERFTLSKFAQAVELGVRKLLDGVKKGDVVLTPGILTQMVAVSIQMARLARGDVTSRSEVRHTQVREDLLARLNQLSERASKKT